MYCCLLPSPGCSQGQGWTSGSVCALYLKWKWWSTLMYIKSSWCIRNTDKHNPSKTSDTDTRAASDQSKCADGFERTAPNTERFPPLVNSISLSHTPFPTITSHRMPSFAFWSVLLSTGSLIYIDSMEMKNLVRKDRPSEECVCAFSSQCQAFFLNTGTGHAYLATNTVTLDLLAR